MDSRFKAADGTELFYRAWLPEELTDKALLLFHRGHEHSGRWAETVAALKLDDVAVFAWDQRGHGKSPGDRGHAEDMGQLVRDADMFVKHIRDEHFMPIENMVLMAHSVGAVVAAAWVHDYAPPIRGMILATPALRVKLYVPLAVPALRLKQKFLGPGIVKSYVKSSVLTHDPGQAASYDNDPDVFKEIAVNVLLDLHDTGTRLLDDAGAITTPTLVLAAGSDWVVQLDAQQTFYSRLSSAVKQFEFFPGFYHAIFHELNRHMVVEKARAFMLDCWARVPDRSALVHSDKGGHTRTEYDLLRSPGGPIWPLTRLAMKAIGHLSTGIGLGWHAGFDSGGTLDYVYKNEPAGLTPVGKLIDKIYLESPGWVGIRRRREHLEQLLRLAIQETLREGRPVQILDIASGPGRYVLEVMRAFSQSIPRIPIAAILRDYRQQNLDAARQLARELDVRDVTTVLGDAFDRASLGASTPRTTIAIASGIYELFPDNAPVLESLRGIADSMDTGGRLIYTCQPWHPQIEFIARVLTNREGKPWIMRRRTQAEVDALVMAAGFEKSDELIDRWGIFSVSVAKKAGG